MLLHTSIRKNGLTSTKIYLAKFMSPPTTQVHKIRIFCAYNVSFMWFKLCTHQSECVGTKTTWAKRWKNHTNRMAKIYDENSFKHMGISQIFLSTTIASQVKDLISPQNFSKLQFTFVNYSLVLFSVYYHSFFIVNQSSKVFGI